MTKKDMIDDLLTKRVLILDGAMGTLIRQRRLSERDCRGDRFRDHHRDLGANADVLVLTQPHVIAGIHRDYLEAGADIIATNSFNANGVSQAEFGLEAEVYEMNVTAAQLARAAADDWSARSADRPRFVAGAIGPTSRPFGASRTAYEDQVRGLIDGGVDLLLIETITDAATAMAAVDAINQVQSSRGVELPLMVSVSVSGPNGTLRSGHTLEEFFASVASARPWSVGINCIDARELGPHLEAVAAVATQWVSVHPNAGAPDAAGVYRVSPSEFAHILRDLAAAGLADIVGGCCGTTPAHIRALSDALERVTPRSWRARARQVAPAPSRPLLTLDQARANRFIPDWDNYAAPVPWFIGRRLIAPELEALAAHVEWTTLPSARLEAARRLLERAIRERRLRTAGAYGFWPANASGDEIVVYRDDSRRTVIATLTMPRQQEAQPPGRPNLSLADFVAPKESLVPDYIGAYVVTAGIGAGDFAAELARSEGDASVSLLTALVDRLTSACAAIVHAQARQDWGYERDTAPSDDDMRAGRFRGLRAEFGDAACPDMAGAAAILRALDAAAIGITPSDPDGNRAVVWNAGLFFAHPDARNVDVGRLG